MPILRIRNPVARAPILRKGGVHVKSKSSQRAKTRKELKDAVVQWEKKHGRLD
jgi:hypothetical protein